ncbi:hypothetical protein HHK36_006515 [Tetracentron sinense]|uniref:Peptidase C1A papain C-terminal domain-containing protein n=1 Tax=Tetracentron sinense TaxID=13715 RepID=A0A834ZHD4_TETSI|nr:hypothetical protein HHK36_006515 [Tetracentron sinense]
MEDPTPTPNEDEVSNEDPQVVIKCYGIKDFNRNYVTTPRLPCVEVSHFERKGSIVEQINANPKAGWQAAMNPRFTNFTIEQFKYLLGVKPASQSDLEDIPVVTHPKSLELPKQFDARTAWPQCVTISKILDQGYCGSCWAFGAVESLSDRFCVHFGLHISLSVNDLLACCGFMCGNGCDGGDHIYAWKFFVSNGVVTEEKCKDKNQLWQESKHFSVNVYRVSSDPYIIMAEVYKNGPVEVTFTVYEDFAHYKSGVYRYITGDIMGGHAVKLIGWGTTDDGDDYWDGYFMIRRGSNECGIEEDVIVGLPSSKNMIRKYAGVDTGRHVSV